MKSNELENDSVPQLGHAAYCLKILLIVVTLCLIAILKNKEWLLQGSPDHSTTPPDVEATSYQSRWNGMRSCPLGCCLAISPNKILPSPCNESLIRPDLFREMWGLQGYTLFYLPQNGLWAHMRNASFST